MAAISGVNGKVTQAGVVVLNMMDWEVDLKATTVDVSAFGGSGWGASLGTIKKWTGKCSGNFDPADTTGQAVLNAGLGSTIAMVFYTDAVHNWTGSAVVTDIQLVSSASGVIKVTYSFEGAASIVYA